MSQVKAEKACLDAKAKLEKLGIEEKIQAELAWVVGSFNYDSNPVGLYEIGNKALKALKSYKNEKPRLVSKKFISEIESALSEN